MTWASPHFTLAELTHSNTATRLDIDNTPLAEEIANLKILAEGLEQVRKCWGTAHAHMYVYVCIL